ncbi:MAG: RsmD family RNA methyltransferase [Anaplasma sp.]
MVRVTAGAYRGRRVFTGSVLKARPVVALVRESVFNILRSHIYVPGTSVCDLCCGSGAFSFEALSRGANYACLVDVHSPNLRLVQKTAVSLGLERKTSILCCDIRRLPQAERNYDIAFIDPPYREPGLIDVALNAILSMRWCNIGSIVVLCVQRGTTIFIPEQYELADRRAYCKSEVWFLRVDLAV